MQWHIDTIHHNITKELYAIAKVLWVKLFCLILNSSIFSSSFTLSIASEANSNCWYLDGWNKGFSIACYICGEDYSLKQCRLLLNIAERYMGSRLREVLDDLAIHFGYYKKKLYWFMRTSIIRDTE